MVTALLLSLLLACLCVELLGALFATEYVRHLNLRCGGLCTVHHLLIEALEGLDLVSFLHELGQVWRDVWVTVIHLQSLLDVGQDLVFDLLFTSAYFLHALV